MIQTVPPKINAASSLEFFAATVLAMVVFGVSAIVFFFNPNTHGFYPICLFHQLTGLNCPGCGSTRAFYALLHGRFELALKDNALFIFSFIGAVIWSTHFLIQKSRRQNVVFNLPPKLLWAFLAIAIIFTVLRNLPAFSFLSP